MAYPGVLDDFKACVALEQPKRMPVFALGLEFDMLLADVSDEAARTDVDAAVRAIVAATRRFDYDWAMVFPDDYIEFEPLGLKMRRDPDRPAMVAEYLPMTPQTLAGFRLPDVHRDGRMPIHLEMLRRTRAALGDTVCVVGRIAAPFSTQALVYGVDTLLLQMFEDAALVRDNLDFFVEHQIAFGRAQIQAGADTLWLGDCVAGSAFISPRHFAQFVREAASRVASALIAEGALVIYHTAETSLAHLALQVEMPVSAVNVGEGVSIADIRRRLGRCMCLMGNFDPLLLRDGTPAQVEAATERMIRDNLPGGGYVFNTGEGIMPTTPPENVENMIAAAKALAGS